MCQDIKKGRRILTLASSWLAKKGGLHMQKSYTISVSSFKASISKVFWGTLTTGVRRETRDEVLGKHGGSYGK